MSDLLVTYEGLFLPPAACAEEPPPENPPLAPPKKSGKNSPAASPSDGCSIVLPLVPAAEPQAKPRFLRFDRKQDRFVLSQYNIAENLTWIGQQKNLAPILDLLRVLEGTLRKTELNSLDVYSLKLSLVQFLVTGQVWLYGPKDKELQQLGNRVDLAEWALEIFTTSSDEAIARLLGPVNAFRGDAALSDAVKGRIHFVNQVLDLRPKYRNFRAHFADPLEVDRWTQLNSEGRKNYKNLLGFLRQTVVREWLGGPLRYGAPFLESFEAFLTLHPERNETQGKDAYCLALETGLRELRGERGLAKESIAECRAVLDWSRLAEEEAVRKSLRHSYLSEAARPLLAAAIEAESRKAGMKVDWLADRGRFAEAYLLLDSQLRVTLPAGEGEPVLALDAQALRVQLNLWVGRHLTQRREHLLAALALLRRTFGESGSPPPARVFHRDGFVQAEWKLEPESLQAIRDYQRELERELKLSQTRSEVGLPLVEFSTCAAGILGLGIAEGYGGMDQHPDFKLGLGATSAGLAGAGCSASLGHYVWPKLGKVRNRYLWEGVTGVAGAAVGVGFYFLARSFRSDPGNPQKFPVDEYGP